jgi:hypothetical protein
MKRPMTILLALCLLPGVAWGQASSGVQAHF